MTERVDVIVPYYNRPTMVRDAVWSALHQDQVETRVILVDDASPTPPPLDGLPMDRVVVITRTQAGGTGASHNTGLQAVTADHVSFLDDDDLYPDYRSFELMRLMQAYDADLVYGGQVVFSDGDTPCLTPTSAQRAAMPPVQPAVLPGTVLMRSDVATSMKPLPEDSLIGTFVQWITAARDGASPPREVGCEVPVLLRRSHTGNITRRNNPGVDFVTAVRRHRQSAGGSQ